ncbi:hypothetical protein [Selenomonas sp. F0473]|uniref:hypothetical protein n=1 Tax=Selenomonas sp. F0473 TaxID=999423 RepID=UPI00029E2BF3|nr:hypothetical protein [Selenomonas sp. F0473]EKU70939.1 hypothetical protein HMPREF9161_01488 [Selenomonas sp. F0473]
MRNIRYILSAAAALYLVCAPPTANAVRTPWLESVPNLDAYVAEKAAEKDAPSRAAIGEGHGVAPAPSGTDGRLPVAPAGTPLRIVSDRHVLRFVPKIALTKPYRLDLSSKGIPVQGSGNMKKLDVYILFNQDAPLVFCVACMHMDEDFYAAHMRGNEESIVQSAYGFAMMLADAARQKREGAGGGFSMETKDRTDLGNFAREFDSTVRTKDGDMREIAVVAMQEPVMWMVTAYYPAAAENIDELVHETLRSVEVETLPGAGAKKV